MEVIMNPPEPRSFASPASENEDSPVGCVRRGRLEQKHIAGRFTLIQITNFLLSIFCCPTFFLLWPAWAWPDSALLAWT